MNNKHKTQQADSLFLQSLISEAQEESESQELIHEINELKPTLKQFHEDVSIAQDNIINLRLGIESQIQWSENMKREILELLHQITYSVVSVKQHANDVSTDISSKSGMKVSGSEARLSSIESLLDRKMQEMKDLHKKQMSEMTNLFAQERKALIEFFLQQQQDFRPEFNNKNCLYLSGFMYWVGCSFFWIGVVVTLVAVTMGIVCLFQ